MSMSRARAALAGAVGAVLIATLLPAVPAVPAAAAPAPVPLVEDPASYVDPFVGTTRGGNTWPGATRPFGMIAWSPTNTTGDQTGAPASNGYDYNVTKLLGFSLTHVNG